MKFRSSSFRFLLSGFLIVLGLSPVLRSVAQKPQQTLEEMAIRMSAEVEFVQGRVELSEFEIAALQKSLGTNPAILTQWVRENTRWVPYPGSLKGPQGTLMAKQGNLIDRNLLLAALLESAGRETRLVHLPVPPELRRDLQKALDIQQRGGRNAFRPEHVTAVELEQFHQNSGLTEDEALQLLENRQEGQRSLAIALNETVASQQRKLLAMMSRAAVPTPIVVPRPASDRYVYVQHRRSPQDPWEAAHLVPQAIPKVKNKESESFSLKELPDTWRHRVALRVVAVQQQGKEQNEHVVLEKAFPVSGVMPLRLALIPGNRSDPEKLIAELQESGTLKPFVETLQSTRTWIPVLIQEGRAPVVGKGVDRSGRVRPVSKIATVGQNEAGLGTALDQLNPLIGQPEGEPSSSVLQEVRLEVVLHAPGEKTSRTVVRPMYRRSAPPDDAGTEELARGLALCSQVDVLIQTGWIPKEYADYEQQRAKRGVAFALDFIADNGAESWLNTTKPAIALRVIEKLTPFRSALYGIASCRSSPATFLSQPNVIGHWYYVRLDEKGRARRITAVDFIANQVKEAGPGSGESRFRTQVEAGIRDSIIENYALSASGKALSTSYLFEEDKGQGWQAVTLESPVLDSPTLPAMARQALRDDLTAGFQVFLRPEPRNAAMVWWRIHPETGECLGMLGTEDRIGGQSMTERNIILTGIGILGVAALVWEFWGDDDAPQPCVDAIDLMGGGGLQKHNVRGLKKVKQHLDMLDEDSTPPCDSGLPSSP